jgi:hypothetical protein
MRAFYMLFQVLEKNCAIISQKMQQNCFVNRIYIRE